MLKSGIHSLVVVSALFLAASFFTEVCAAQPYRVLVVMSYESGFPWCGEIKKGIDSVLGDSCDIQYFYMDTKTNLQGGPEKAREAYELFESFGPAGVIAADDNAQSMFVVPYLKDKVKTPVMFCGVNAVPEQYGYPASNVSGILERLHISESIAFARQILPDIKTVGFIMKAGPSSKQVHAQVEREKAGYQATVIDFKMPKTLEEALDMTEALKSDCDLLFLETLQGVTGPDGNPLPDSRAMPLVVKTFGKPSVGSNQYAVELVILCAVVKTGQEQGDTAARMLLKAMKGTPPAEIPILMNLHGKRIINVDSMMKLGIKPKSIILRGSELVKTRSQPDS